MHELFTTDKCSNQDSAAIFDTDSKDDSETKHWPLNLEDEAEYY